MMSWPLWRPSCYSSSEMSGYVNPKRVKSQTIVKTFFAYLNLYSKTPELESICVRGDASSLTVHANKSDTEEPGQNEKPQLNPHVQLIPNASVNFCKAPDACLDELKAMREKETGTAFFERRPQVHDKRSQTKENCLIDQTRWELMTSALSTHTGLLKDRILLAHTVSEGGSGGGGERGYNACLHLRPDQLVAEHIQNWPSSDLLRNVGGLVVGMVLWFANLCYGAIHVAAWNDHFPSTTEMWLWRASSSYIAFCGGLWVVLNFIVARLPQLNDFWEHWADGEKTSFENFGLGLIVFICGFSLVFARIFVVVEAFVSIREQPLEAYATPEWTNIFPHF